ncbi:MULTISPECIES: hypothetical protein [unclassified Pseudonocardia]|nr:MULTISPECIES: hypothetical protein [unclassified Pseudonocardia]
MTLRPDIAAWLGDPPDPPLDADQADRITDLIDTLADRWPDPDASNELEAAMYGAVQIVLGAVTLETFAENHLRALYAEREAMAALHGAVLASATGARSPLPGSEIDLINRARLSRTTVRRIIGR